MNQLLLVDANLDTKRSLQKALEHRGFRVEALSDGRLALNRIQLDLADVCVLGTGVAEMEAITVLRRARAAAAMMPIVILARAEEPANCVTWFDAGADDVVGRPFDPDELAVRLRAVCRRSAIRSATEVMGCGPLTFDILSGSFLLGGELLDFTPKEHAFIRALIPRPGYVVPKDRLHRAVFADAVNISAIDVLACRVRRKLIGSGVSVATIRSMGYLLREDRPSAVLAA